MGIMTEKREDGKQKLVENYLLPTNMIEKLPLKESRILHEGKQYECVAAYRFPISRPDKENYNERVYTSALWENVIKNQKQVWEGAFGLCDHPEGEGSVKDAFCAWHNVHMGESSGEKLVFADAYLFGEWGRHANEAIQAGGRLGMSSVGYGDFKSDGKTIDESTYELERPSDWVMNPSYGVFGSLEDKIEQAEKSTTNKVEEHVIDAKDNEDTVTLVFSKHREAVQDEEGEEKEESVLPKNNGTNNVDSSPIKEKRMSDKSQKLLERNFKEHVNSKMEKLTEASVSERIDGYKSLLEMFVEDEVDFADDLREKVQTSLQEAENELKELAEKGKEVDSLKESSETTLKEKTTLEEAHKTLKEEHEKLEKKYEKATQLLDDLKVYTNKMKELYETTKAEKNGMVSASEYRELSVYAEGLEKELKETKAQIRILEKRKNRKTLSDTQKEKVLSRLNRKSEQEDGEDEDDEEEDDEEEMEESSDFRNDADVKAYYKDLVEQYPNAKKFRKEFLKSKTVLEAQRVYWKFQELIEDEDIPSPYKREGFAPVSTLTESTEKRQSHQVTGADKLKHKGWI